MSDFNSIQTDVTFSSGSPDGTTECVNISVIDDFALEVIQNFSVALTASDHGVIVGRNVTTISITDNDSKLTVKTIKLHHASL